MSISPVFMIIIILLAVIMMSGCTHMVNGHSCPPGSRNMDCMIAEGRL